MDKMSEVVMTMDSLTLISNSIHPLILVLARPARWSYYLCLCFEYLS